jgi:signal transduction histidine kinase
MIIRPIKKLTSVAERLEHGDFSQRVKLRSNAENEIGLLGRALNTMAASLERQEQLRRNMVSDIAHELRTPLTNICCYLEVLQGGVIQPTAQVIASLNEEALLLRRLVNDLQELSLAEARQLLLQLQSVALYDLIPSAIEAIRPGALEKRITVLSLLSAGLPDVQVDADRIGQVLRNLLQNAIRHTPVDGNITITALAQNNEVQISVQDTGEGIEEEYLPNIFERFYRADTSRSRATGGSGLGLAIARHLIQAHGGDIKVESRPGYGACFIFTLPTVTSMGSMS